MKTFPVSLCVALVALTLPAISMAQLPAGGLPMPQLQPNEATAAVKALARTTDDLQKFVGLNPKAQISQAQVTFQNDGGYLVTISSQVCEDVTLPPLPTLPLPAPQDGLPPSLPGQLPFGPPIGGGFLPIACPTYGMLVIHATVNPDSVDGYDYHVLSNGTLPVRK